MEKPKPSTARIINETRQVGICNKCKSSLVRKHLFWFGKKFCINTDCK